ncbi:MAG: PP2C family protein-serine/threonine phosphatase [Brevinematia bacterium]
MKQKLLYTIISLIFLGISYLLISEFVNSYNIVGKKIPPFLVTKQLGIDSIGMFLKEESFKRVFPLSYIEKINGISVKSDEEYYKIISELANKTNEITVEFAIPFFLDIFRYSTKVKLYEITYTDYFITFLVPLTFSLILLSISFYFSIVLIKNFKLFSIKKKQMMLGGILLFLDMYFLTVGGIDLVSAKKYLSVLYISFAITGLVLSIFFYYITPRRDNLWIYAMSINIILSLILLTSYIIFFTNTPMLLSFVKINYLIIFINVLIGFLYLIYTSSKETNVIEKQRQKTIFFILLIPIITMSIIFLLQSLSLQTLPISLSLLALILFSPIITTVINDHNVIYSKERIIFSFIISLTTFFFLLVLTSVSENIEEKGVIIFGLYVIPSTLFLSMAIWYGIEFLKTPNLRFIEVPIELKSQNLKKYLFARLKKKIPSISKIEIVLQYPTAYIEQDFLILSNFSNIWESEERYLTINDTTFIEEYQENKKLFDDLDIDYAFFFETDNTKGFVGIKTNKSFSSIEIEQIKTLVEIFSVDLHSFSILNEVKLAKVLSFEFELLRQSQENLLKSNKIITIPTSLGELKIIHYWDPITELAGDIYGTNTIGEYITSWISDICGKGLLAAAISFTCYSLINQVIKQNISIHKTAKLVNDILITEQLFSVESFFLTLSGITINTSTLEAEIVNCGNPPIILFDGKEVYEIKPKGTILGIFDSIEIESFKFKLSKGTFLLTFSDGMTDVITPENEISNDQIEYIKDIVKSIKNPEMVWNRIISEINKNKEKLKLLDDITLSIIYLE